MVQGPPVFIPFESNAEDEGNKIIRALKKIGDVAQTSLGNAAAKAQEKFSNAIGDTSKELQSQEEITRRARLETDKLIKSYFGLEKFERAQTGRNILVKDDLPGLQRQAFQMRDAGIKPEFSEQGFEVVDKRSVENAKMVEEELSMTAQSTRQVRNDMDETDKRFKNISDSSAPRLRYAMYDISNSARRIGLALGALAIGPIAAAIQYEKDFANVVRTTGVVGEEIDQLRGQLIEIAQLTPIPWEDITAIATLAGQLGIAETSVANFTETVAKFAATTDLTVESAATAFGRLDQLIDGVNGNFNNLGSAILAVGVDSVATESQIVNVSTQIASMGNLAGLTGADIVGLSGALASLGIRPELARGNITRLFSNIGAAVAQGGRNLEEYGRLTDRTAAEFAEAWSSEPTEVLLDFFEGIQREGSAAESTLREIGITSVRDIPAILRLAQSQDEVRRLIALSNEEFEFGIAVNEQYGIISDTVAAQLQRLGQNFKTLFATIGEVTTGPLNGIIQGINALVVGLTALSKTAGGQTFLFIAGTITLLGAALAGLVTIIASVFAGFLAYRLALKEMGVSTGRAALSNLILYGSFQAVEKGAKGATVAARAFRIATAGLLFGLPLIVGGVAALAAAFSNTADEAESAKEKAEEFFGDTGAFLEAVREDTQDFNKAISADFGGDFSKALEEGFKGDAIDVQTVAISKNQDEARELLRTTRDVIDGQEDLEDAVDGATGAVDRQAIAYGENALAFLRSAFIQDENIQAFANDPALRAAFQSVGGDFQELLKASLSGEGVDYLEGVREDIIAELNAIEGLRREAQASDDDELLAQLNQRANDLRAAYDAVEAQLIPAAEAVDALRVATEATLAAEDLFSESLEETAEYASLTAEQINLIIERIFGLENRLEAAEDAARDFGEELRETGLEGEGLRGNIEDLIKTILLLDTGPEQQIANLAALLAFMKANALGTPEALQAIEDAIYEIGATAAEQNPEIAEFVALMLATGGGGIADIDSVLAAITDGINGIGDSADETGGKIKTLQERFEELLDAIFAPINAARDAAQAIFDLGEAYAELGEDALYSSKEVQDATRAILATSGSPEEAIANLNALYARLAQTVGSQTAPSLNLLRQVIQAVSQEFGVAADIVSGATIDLNFFNMGLEQTTKEVRTLSDFAGDLRKVIDRAFDLRFATTFEIDRIAESWEKLSDEVEDARYQVEELIASQKDLSADRALKEYFLSVADAYGDTLRAAQLRKEIAKLDREQAQNARELQEAQQIAGGVLTGQGAGIRQNRGALLDLVQNYQDYITTLAESGASQDELREATEEARREFIAQARELGFQEDVVLQYAQAFDDVTFAINNVPRNITVDANTNPAIQALNELNAKLNESIDLARELNRVSGQPVSSPDPGPNNGGDTSTERAVLQADLNLTERRIRSAQLGLRYGVPGTADYNAARDLIESLGDRADNIRSRINQLYTGGFTGRGGKFEPAGIVHRGEYVIPKQYVNQSTGLPDPSFLAQLQNGVRGYQMGGFVGGGGMSPGDAMMVELSPYDRKLLENAGNVQLRLNGRVVAEATNQNNLNEARRGSN